jgi:hypothetical protein
MDLLLNGALATGNSAFHPGSTTISLDSDSLSSDKDSDSEIEVMTMSSASSKVWFLFLFLNLFAEMAQAWDDSTHDSTPLKRKASARDPGSESNKRSRRDRTGRLSTSGAITQMSKSIEGMASVFGGSQSSEPVRLGQAVALLEKEKDIPTKDKARLMLIAQQDIAFADLILSVKDVDTRHAIYQLKLE